jgi:hypothetical protein
MAWQAALNMALFLMPLIISGVLGRNRKSMIFMGKDLLFQTDEDAWFEKPPDELSGGNVV